MIKEYIIKIDEDQSKKDIHGGYPLIEPPLELIRCMYCKYWDDNGIITKCEKHIGNGYPGDWFCDDGERKNS